jgi:tetratricopeptide (TPR) repeat protein
MECPLTDRITAAAELAEVERELGYPRGADWGLIFLCHHHTEQGDVAAADACLAKLKEVAAELSHPTNIWRSTVIEAMRALMMGRFDEADHLAFEAFGVGQKVAEENAGQYLIAAMLVLRWLQGRLAELKDMWRSASEPYAEVPLYRSVNAWFHLMVGGEDKAREEFERFAERNFTEIPQDYMSTYFMLMFLSEVAVAIGDTRRATLLYHLLRPHADYLLMMGLHCVCHGATTHWLGMLAATLKRWDDAVAHFEDAIETNSRIGARPYLARSQHEYARMLIERNKSGDKEKARTLLTEATATYRELGMPTFLENAEELLGSL